MQIRYIDVDKLVAAPYNAGTDGNFPPPEKYFHIGIQVFNDDGSIPTAATPVYLGDRKERGRIQYWATVKDKLTNVTDTVDGGGSVDTDVHGYLDAYVAVSNKQVATYPGCIFELLASPTPNFEIDGVNQTLTCCYSTYAEALAVADQSLDPLILSDDSEHLVSIPPWHTFTYNTSVNLQSLADGYSENTKMHIIINGKRVDNLSWHYGDLLNGVDIPYPLMVLGDGLERNNCILYLLDGVGRPGSSVPWNFPIQGVPILMPDPGKQGPYFKPGWWGEKPNFFDPPEPQPMILDMLYTSNDDPGFDVVVQAPPDVQPGDVYRIYIYQNGYKDGVQRTLLLGDGTPIPDLQWGNILEIKMPADVKPGQILTISAPIKASTGFNQLDPRDPGYLWVNYQVNGGDWSTAYPSIDNPARIDFADKTPGGSKQDEEE